MKTRIHVNQHNIKRNALTKNHGGPSDKLPVLTVKTYNSNTLGNNIRILDSAGNLLASVIYSPDKPLSCGAKVWIETNQTVEIT